MARGEQIPDVDAGSEPEVNSSGLTAAEQTEFDAMKNADRAPPAEGEPAPDAGEHVDPEPGEADDAGDDDAGEADDAMDGDAAGTDARKDAAPKLDADGKPIKDGKPRTISYNKAERERKKLADRLAAAELDRDSFKERFNRLDERTRVLLEAINTRAAPAKVEPPPDPKVTDPEPDENDDPIAHASWTRRELGRTQAAMADLAKRFDGDVSSRAAQTQQSDLVGRYTQDIEGAIAADPTFAAAYEIVRESRYTELGQFFAGIDINDPEQVKTLTAEEQGALKDRIVHTFNGEQLEVAKNAFGRKQSPSKYILGLARARGFDPAKAAADIAARATAGDGNGNGSAAPAARAPAATNGRQQPLIPAKKPTASEELQAIRDGQAASRSLSDAGGSPGGAITADAILKMGDDEFADLYARLPKAQLDALMGK